jgi:MscS family membrane protein
MASFFNLITDLETAVNNPYLVALIIFIVFVVLAKALILVTKKVVLKITAKTKTKVDDMIVNSTYRYASFIIIILGVRLASLQLSFTTAVAEIVNKILDSLLIVVFLAIGLIVILILLNSWGINFAKKTKSTVDEQLINLSAKLLKIVAMILGVIFILDIWGVEVGPLVASLGIVGLALAFGLQNTLGNVFGGVSLILDKAYKKGDMIQLDSKIGTVYEIGLRSTKIKTFDNEILVIPNDKLANNIVENYNLPDPTIRVNIEFGVEYGSNPDAVKKLALDIVKKTKNVLNDPEASIFFTEMGESSLNFKLMFYVDDLKNKWETHQSVITELYNTLNKNKIGIPFPTRTVYNKKD